MIDKRVILQLFILLFTFIELTANELKVLFLIPACDNEPIWIEHQHVWRTYMHSDPEHVTAYFMKGNPNLALPYQIDKDIIWCKCEESYIPGIINKTILSMECLLPIIDQFDYVVRVSSSSFYHFPRLLSYLSNLPKERCYRGVIGFLPEHGEYVSGSGTIFTPDLIKLAVQFKDEIKRSFIDDDVALGIFFREHGIFPVSAPREDLIDMEDWNRKKETTPHFHFRIHNSPSHVRVDQDLPVYIDLLRKFYGMEIQRSVTHPSSDP